MKIDARFFGQYAITGTFFWIAQYIVLEISSLEVPALAGLKELQAGLSSALNSAPAMAALAIAGVFFTGLLLDVASAYFVRIEGQIFTKNLIRNKGWLEPMLQDYSTYLGDDYDYLCRQSAPGGEQKDGFSGLLRHWRKFARSYRRLQALLLSYVRVFSNKEALESLSEQMLLWRTSRAIAVTMIIVALEILGSFLVFSFYSIYYNQPHLWGSWFTSYVIALVSFVVGWGGGLLLQKSAYTQMCDQLFALAYATTKKVHAADKPSEGIEGAFQAPPQGSPRIS